MTNYVLTEGPDSTLWVSIQPLQRDILNSIKEMSELDNLSDEQNSHVNMKILGLRSIYDFLDALIMEHQISKVKNENSH